MSLLTAGGLEEMTFKGPFQPKIFYDSTVSRPHKAEEKRNTEVLYKNFSFSL